MKPEEESIEMGMAGDGTFSACWEHAFQPGYHVIRWSDASTRIPQVEGHGSSMLEAIKDARASFDALIEKLGSEENGEPGSTTGA